MLSTVTLSCSYGEQEKEDHERENILEPAPKMASPYFGIPHCCAGFRFGLLLQNRKNIIFII